MQPGHGKNRFLMTAMLAVSLPSLIPAQVEPTTSSSRPTPISQPPDRRVNYGGRPGTLFKRPGAADSMLHIYLNLDGQNHSFELEPIHGSEAVFTLRRRESVNVVIDAQGEVKVIDFAGHDGDLGSPDVAIAPDRSVPPETPRASAAPLANQPAHYARGQYKIVQDGQNAFITLPGEPQVAARLSGASGLYIYVCDDGRRTFTYREVNAPGNPGADGLWVMSIGGGAGFRPAIPGIAAPPRQAPVTPPVAHPAPAIVPLESWATTADDPVKMKPVRNGYQPYILYHEKEVDARLMSGVFFGYSDDTRVLQSLDPNDRTVPYYYRVQKTENGFQVDAYQDIVPPGPHYVENMINGRYLRK